MRKLEPDLHRGRCRGQRRGKGDADPFVVKLQGFPVTNVHRFHPFPYSNAGWWIVSTTGVDEQISARLIQGRGKNAAGYDEE